MCSYQRFIKTNFNCIQFFLDVLKHKTIRQCANSDLSQTLLHDPEACFAEENPPKNHLL